MYDIEQVINGKIVIREAVQIRYIIDRNVCNCYYDNNEKIQFPTVEMLPIIYVDILEEVKFDDATQHAVPVRLYLNDNIVVKGSVYIKPSFPFKLTGERLIFDGRYNQSICN